MSVSIDFMALIALRFVARLLDLLIILLESATAPMTAAPTPSPVRIPVVFILFSPFRKSYRKLSINLIDVCGNIFFAFYRDLNKGKLWKIEMNPQLIQFLK